MSEIKRCPVCGCDPRLNYIFGKLLEVARLIHDEKRDNPFQGCINPKVMEHILKQINEGGQNESY